MQSGRGLRGMKVLEQLARDAAGGQRRIGLESTETQGDTQRLAEEAAAV